MNKALPATRVHSECRLRDSVLQPFRAVTYLSLVLVCGSLHAAGTVVNDQSAGPFLQPAEAQQYAHQLGRIVEQVRDKYMQPVSRAELTEAALRGLYAAAQRPMPARLHAEVRTAGDDLHALQQLLTRERENLGNVESLRGPLAVLASLHGISQALDPFSTVLTGTELDRNDTSSNDQRSLGWELVADAPGVPLAVKTVTPGGPAQKAGLRPGDQITPVNGQAAPGFPTGPTLSLVQNPPGPTAHAVQVQVYRPSTQTSWNLTLKPEKFRAETVRGVIRGADNSWDYFLDHERRIAHVRIGSMERGTAEDLARVLSDLTEAGMRGLILDLRWSPISYLDQARYVADLFIGGYLLPRLILPTPGNLVAVADLYLSGYPKNAAVASRDHGLDDHYPSADPGFIDFPMIVLINGETSGGAELVAAVLQDNLRAKIAGQRSRGKGSVQTILGLQEDFGVKDMVPRAALKLSNGMIVRPSGRNLHRFADSKPTDDWGVRPDPGLELRISADLSRQLRDWWQLQDLRPGTSNETLPLDDPVADPQRQGALQVLIKLLGPSSRPGS